MARVLLLVAKTSYRTDAFLAATRRLAVTPLLGSDRCHVLDGLLDYPEDTLALEFRHPERAVEQIVEAARGAPIDAIVPTDDTTAYIGALAARALGLPGNPPEAAYTARNKRRMREALARAGVPCPRFHVFPVAGNPAALAAEAGRTVGYPCVLKPLLLSASRGVMRADDERQFVAAFARLRAMLTTPEMRAAAEEDAAGAEVLVERFVPGAEVALEGVLVRGRLDVLAIFDKPDPLDGPFFEETIYVTPSRLPPDVQDALARVTGAAAAAMGLEEGPVHAELRLEAQGPCLSPVAIEVAARTIGGLCARTLRFSLGEGELTLEDLVVAHALGRTEASPAQAPLDRRAGESPGPGAAGVMMLPIPRGGVLEGWTGEEEARAVAGVVDVTITVRAGEKLVPLPEGASYLGFLFARGESPEEVEKALREAHRRLRFDVAPLL